MKRFCCLSIPQFPARAVLWAHPELQGQAILVHAGGRVVAASAACCAAGVEPGWPLERAQALFPHAVPHLHQGALTMAAWETVLRTLEELTPFIEPLQSGMVLLQGARLALLQPLLAAWQGSAGMADDRTTAELAAHAAHTGKIRRVPPGAGPAFLDRLPVAVLARVGVSAETLERLEWFGWRHIGDLRRVTRRQLTAQFPEGEVLDRYSRGTGASGERPVAAWQPPATVNVRWPFDEPACEPHQLRPVLLRLLELGCHQLQNRLAHSLTLQLAAAGKVGAAAGEVGSAQRLLARPEGETRPLHHAACGLLDEIMSRAPGFMVQEMRLALGGLVPRPAVQGELFPDQQKQRRRCLQAVLRHLEQRFPGCMRHAVCLNPTAYLAEEAYRLEPVS